MPLLQVRDFPSDIYERIGIEAKLQHRTIAQQTIVLIEKGLELEISPKERRRRLSEQIRARDISERWKDEDPAALIREMREERTNQIIDAIEGKR